MVLFDPKSSGNKHHNLNHNPLSKYSGIKHHPLALNTLTFTHMVLPLSTSSQEVSCIEPPKLPHRMFLSFYNPYLPPHKNTNINRYFNCPIQMPPNYLFITIVT
jgi:hypothetical protein